MTLEEENEQKRSQKNIKSTFPQIFFLGIFVSRKTENKRIFQIRKEMEGKRLLLLDLPKNVLLYLLSFSTLCDLFHFSLVCKKSASLFKEDFLWKQLCFREKLCEEQTEKTWLNTFQSLTSLKWAPTPNLETKYRVENKGRKLISELVDVTPCLTDKPLSPNKIYKSKFLFSFSF